VILLHMFGECAGWGRWAGEALKRAAVCVKRSDAKVLKSRFVEERSGNSVEE
jgi:hypothetical protein